MILEQRLPWAGVRSYWFDGTPAQRARRNGRWKLWKVGMGARFRVRCLGWAAGGDLRLVWMVRDVRHPVGHCAACRLRSRDGDFSEGAGPVFNIARRLLRRLPRQRVGK